jgi:DNA-binding transcriptional LysR family regulator
MELRHLRYFVAVAEEGHITRAAERLGIQQPPLSRQINAIERELDVRLFRRKARGVELTDAGRALLEDARATLAALDRSFDRTRRTARGEQGQIRVGIPPTAPFHPFVPRVIRSFREAFPLVSLTLEEFLSNELTERLQKEQMDAAFIRTSLIPEGLVITPVLEEPMVVALPVGHALVPSDRHAAVSLKHFVRETFILYGPPGTGNDATMAACRAAGFTPRIGQYALRVTSTLALVAVGLGVSIVPASLQRMTIDGVTYRRLKGHMQPKFVMNLASRRGDPSVIVQHFLNSVKRAAKDFRRDRN